MIMRKEELNTLNRLLRTHPAVGIIGARQVGKTTLAKMLAKNVKQLVTHFDLEHPEDLESNPKLGATWEGFVIDQNIRLVAARREECYFWATHAGDQTFQLSKKIRAIAISNLLTDLKRIS